jgi:hypothetical protein
VTAALEPEDEWQAQLAETSLVAGSALAGRSLLRAADALRAATSNAPPGF